MTATTEAQRAAAALRLHALVGAVAIIAGVTIALRSPMLEVPMSDGRGGFLDRFPLHLGITAPLWLLAAWLLLAQRRRWPTAATALAISAASASLAAAAALATEPCSALATRASSSGVNWVNISTAIGVLGAACWLTAVCHALARVAAQLAANTLHLPSVRIRVRALYLGVALRAFPLSLAAALVLGALVGVLMFLAVASLGLLTFVGGQLALAHLLAQSRELAGATVTIRRA